MTRPDWCPQDVWDDTGMEFDKLYDAEPDLEGGCEQGIREVLARGAVEAYARGLEDAARVADAAAEKCKVYAADHIQITDNRTVEDCWIYAQDEAQEIAAAIRALGSK